MHRTALLMYRHSNQKLQLPKPSPFRVPGRGEQGVREPLTALPSILVFLGGRPQAGSLVRGDSSRNAPLGSRPAATMPQRYQVGAPRNPS